MADNQADNQGNWTVTFYRGLKTLVDTSFPKRCPKCGASFTNADDFLKRTKPVRNLKLQETSGLFALDPEADTGVGLFRNCVCGTTLMADFRTRRDNSPEGARRREQFDNLLNMLIEKGVDHATARTELLNVLGGRESRIVDTIIGRDRLPSPT
jgi:hypothetical protein